MEGVLGMDVALLAGNLYSLRQLPSAELYVLEIDHQPASFMIVYRHRDHLLMPRLAIDTSFGRYSPGILLILEAAKRWMTEGVVDFDMCRGDERYKKEMGGINEPLCRNRVGGKRSSFSPTFVFRPLTPPYVRFRIRRFLFWVPFDV